LPRRDGHDSAGSGWFFGFPDVLVLLLLLVYFFLRHAHQTLQHLGKRLSGFSSRTLLTALAFQMRLELGLCSFVHVYESAFRRLDRFAADGAHDSLSHATIQAEAYHFFLASALTRHSG
jgi:hypothetical protein